MKHIIVTVQILIVAAMIIGCGKEGNEQAIEATFSMVGTWVSSEKNPAPDEYYLIDIFKADGTIDEFRNDIKTIAGTYARTEAELVITYITGAESTFRLSCKIKDVNTFQCDGNGEMKRRL